MNPIKQLALVLCFYVCATAQPYADAARAPVPGAEAVGLNNRGVGLMGRFEYEQAAALFSTLAESYPQWLDVRVNRAIAVLNRQQEGDEQAALGMVDAVLQGDAENIRAHYVAGLLRLYLGQGDAAERHFRAVAAADPADAHAAYYLGQCLAQRGEFSAAFDNYRLAAKLDPYLRSAYYGAFQAARRLGLREEARALLGEYQKLERNPRATLAEFRYTRMGAKGEALALDLPSPRLPPRPSGALFGERRPVLPEFAAAADARLTLTSVDLDADGFQDLFAATSTTQSATSIRILKGAADGTLTPLENHPLAGVDKVNAVLWGDYDNDGLVDAYFCRQGANQLWRQQSQGQWRDVSADAGVGGGAFDTVDGAMFDADHDGDLDLFLVNADGPNALFNNDLNGRFRPLAAQQGLAGSGGGRQVLPVDLDGDRDADLVVLNGSPPHEVYLNERLWAYRPAAALAEFTQAPAQAVLAMDLDADGRQDLVTLDPQGVLSAWRADPGAPFVRRVLGRFPRRAGESSRLLALDADGDGSLEMLLASPRGWTLVAPAPDGRELMAREQPDGDRLLGALALLAQAGQGPALAGLSSGQGLFIDPPGPGRFPFLALRLSGKAAGAETTRSNVSGIGARVALRTGSRWSLPPAYRFSSGPGQSLQPLALGLGGAVRADFVAVEWSDGVLQTELDLDVGVVHGIEETQRQLSSCPVLFAWNGEQYAFVTDFLGVGGIGYALGPGEYAEPRPWENLLLPADLPAPRAGRFAFKLTEPMEEVAYLDAARLALWDLPPGWQMVLDERMGVLGPAPTGEVRFYRRERLPQRALDQRGEDVTEWLIAGDGRAAPPGPLDRRFVGRLESEHMLQLQFDRPLAEPPGAPMLVIDGWVEYPYSQTMFAAWQAGASFDAPSVEARDGEGRWHRILDQFGYPAGMPRRMSVPLQNLPPDADALRIRTNMEIYWDRIAVAYAEPLEQARRSRLPLVEARMARSGFPRWTYAAQRRPVLEYARRSPFWDTRHMAGWYTRFGPVADLVAEVDDAVAIIGPGEEVHLEFAADVPPLPAGWTRRFVLETNGWAKDMDLFTRDGETVGPMPESGKPAERREALHERYNTRYRDG